ncbi:MAG: response regulator [Ruminococcus sp.]|nr:response regulator [Ruminococcus sp.]
MKKSGKRNYTATVTFVGSVVLALVMVAGTLWMGQSTQRDTEKAVRTVSLMYLDELADRREQVVENNLQDKIDEIYVSLDMHTDENMSDMEHLAAYEEHVKRHYNLELFACVDTDGLIYTSNGIQTNIDDYSFDYRTLTEPDISVLNPDSIGKKIIIAVPVDIPFRDKQFCVCFMQMDVSQMLEGVSMTTDVNDTTFCNIYTEEGASLTSYVLGGLAEEDNLLDALKHAEFEEPYSYESFLSDFQRGASGVVSFSYNGIKETLSYTPVVGTKWQLTYLIRESIINESISPISKSTIKKSILQSILTVMVMLVMFGFVVYQIQKNNRLQLERETADAENRVKQDELEQRLALQESLLKEKKQREQQNNLISALSSDYWSVYYIDLENGEGVCYQAHRDLDGKGFKESDHFPYLDAVTAYANQYVTEAYREDFIRFVQPDNLKNSLKNNRVISLTYMVSRHGKESYETVRAAGVRHTGDNNDILQIGACFADTDAQTRKEMAQRQALSDALAAAEDASKAKTAFLSNMSHEIRTPMDAIIGLDNLALNDPDTPEKTKDYLKKIGSSAEHLLQLINDILDMTRIESGRLTLKNEEFSFSKLLEAINTMFSSQCHENGLDYQCHIIGHVDDFYIGDNMKLRQVLINILGNAVKFTPSGGCIELQVERTARYDGKSTLQFTVIDNGIGMSEEFLPKIFETFSQEDSSTTNKFGSSGLGMAITKNIVEMMNGNIRVESAKGKGTTFVVTVTLSDAAYDMSRTAETEIHPGDMTVLVVDDDPIAGEHAKLVLEKAGIASEIASSGEQAIEMVRLRHARREPYNLILIDWQMPQMNGIETTKHIREITGDESAIIILTAYKWDDILDEAMETGVDSFLSKPLFASSVIEEFQAALQRKNLSYKQNRKKIDLAGRRILLAEDMAVNAEIMKMVLQMRELEVDHAQNGKIAVEAFSSHPEGWYDAILMDMRMPEMDGLEATRAIRGMNRADAKTIPIIALTANAFDEDVQRSLQSGLNAHLSKPVQPDTLFSTLESLIQNNPKNEG